MLVVLRYAFVFAIMICLCSVHELYMAAREFIVTHFAIFFFYYSFLLFRHIVLTGMEKSMLIKEQKSTVMITTSDGCL